METRTILFLCAHNSARSQMAEGLVNARLGERYRAFSAGSKATRVHPMAIKAMAETGIDISAQRSKTTDAFAGRSFDFVVTVCSEAETECPFFPGPGERIHRPFPDPAACRGTEEEIQECFRKTRDEIWAWLEAEFGDGPGAVSSEGSPA
jgi:arsenate reductase